MPNNWLQEDYIKAYKFAEHAHHEQKIPGTEIPYIMHLTFVSMEVIAALSAEANTHGNLAVKCAILHDTIEDTNVTFEQLKSEFGLDVANGVLALTKNKQLAKPLQMADSLRRIKEQVSEIWMVKLADRITNLQPPPHYWTQDKIIQYSEEAMSIFTALKDASPYLATRLYGKIETYKNFIVTTFYP
jgi:(p)ppGpp synthase/HD superfamily hydrolase